MSSENNEPMSTETVAYYEALQRAEGEAALRHGAPGTDAEARAAAITGNPDIAYQEALHREAKAKLDALNAKAPREQPPVLGVSVECLREARYAMLQAAERIKRQGKRLAQLEQTSEAYRTLCIAVNLAGMSGRPMMNYAAEEDSVYHLERLARMIVLPGEPATATGFPSSTDSGAGSEEIHPSTSFAETGMHAAGSLDPSVTTGGLQP